MEATMAMSSLEGELSTMTALYKAQKENFLLKLYFKTKTPTRNQENLYHL